MTWVETVTRRGFVGFVLPLAVGFGYSKTKDGAQDRLSVEQYNEQVRIANAAIDDFVASVNNPATGVPHAWNSLMSIVGGFNGRTLDLKRRQMRDDAIATVRSVWFEVSEKLDDALIRIGVI